MSKKIKIPKTSLRATFKPSSFDKEKRTIEVVFSTGKKGLRYTWTGKYYEELSMQKSHIRLDRMNKGAPVLNNHISWRLSDNLGVVEKAYIKNKEGVAVLRLSGREEVAGIVKDIEDGIIRNLSIGYVVHKFEETTKKGDKVPTYRAVDWEPYEVSFVNMPFDENSQVRSLDNEKESDGYEVELIRSVENDDETLPETNDNQDQDNPESPNENDQRDDSAGSNNNGEKLNVEKNGTSDDTDKDQERNQEIKSNQDEENMSGKLEKQRIMEIQSSCRKAGLKDEFATKLIEDDVKIEDARKMIIDEMASRQAPANINTVDVNDTDQRSMRIKMASSALLNRSNPEKYEYNKDSREFRGMSLIRLAAEILRHQNVKVAGLSDNEIAVRALHSTSDFVEILANVANKSLRDAYLDQPQTFAEITRNVFVNDFKEISRTQLGDAPILEKLKENGEVKHGTMSEAAEKYYVETFAKIVGITRKTLVNDDLDAFSRMPAMFGARARDLESDLIYDIINTNPNMADGNALFSVAHGNLAQGGDIGAIAVPTVSAARAAMRLQTGLDGRIIQVTPRYLYTPVTLESDAEQFLGRIVPEQVANVNPHTTKLSNISEARLDANSVTAWYLMSGKADIDMFELAKLTGQSEPMIETKVGFEVEGVKIKVTHDVGAKAIDWRGMYKNAGA